MVGRRALAGLAAAPETFDKRKEKLAPREEHSVSPSPAKHGRIPSTGNRATVMDVAQALNEVQQGNDSTVRPQSPRSLSPNPQNEKSKSSFEKYSSFMMPPLKEERTPVSSPAGTLAKSAGEALLDSKFVSESSQSSPRVEMIADSIHPPGYIEGTLPKVDVDALLTFVPSAFTTDSKIHTISVEILSINDGNAISVLRDIHIFYDTEVLVIVHRAKSRESGLVSTRVWCWHGKKCRFGEKEEKKAGELARRYGSTLVSVHLQEGCKTHRSLLGNGVPTTRASRACSCSGRKDCDPTGA